MLYRFVRKCGRKLKDTCDKVIELPDSSKKIAQGVALGTALEFLPLPFISIPISFIVAKLLRFNAAAAVLSVIFFKWAFPFCFAFNYYIGKLILGDVVSRPSLADSSFLTGPQAWLGYIESLGYPFMIGAVINSVVVFIITYFLVSALLDYYRKKRKPQFVKLSRPEEIK